MMPRTKPTSRIRPSGMCQIGGAHFGEANGSELAGTMTLSDGVVRLNSQPISDHPHADQPNDVGRSSWGTNPAEHDTSRTAARHRRRGMVPGIASSGPACRRGRYTQTLGPSKQVIRGEIRVKGGRPEVPAPAAPTRYATARSE